MGGFFRGVARFVTAAIIAIAVYAVMGVGLDKLSDVTTGAVHNAAEQLLAFLAPISLGFLVLIILFGGSFVLLGRTKLFRKGPPSGPAPWPN